MTDDISKFERDRWQQLAAELGLPTNEPRPQQPPAHHEVEIAEEPEFAEELDFVEDPAVVAEPPIAARDDEFDDEPAIPPAYAPEHEAMAIAPPVLEEEAGADEG